MCLNIDYQINNYTYSIFIYRSYFNTSGSTSFCSVEYTSIDFFFKSEKSIKYFWHEVATVKLETLLKVW